MIHIIRASGGLYDWAVLCYTAEGSLDSYCLVLFMEVDTRGHSVKSGEEWIDGDWFTVQASPFPSMSIRRLLWMDVVFDMGPANDHVGHDGSNAGGFENATTGGTPVGSGQRDSKMTLRSWNSETVQMETVFPPVRMSGWWRMNPRWAAT